MPKQRKRGRPAGRVDDRHALSNHRWQIAGAVAGIVGVAVAIIIAVVQSRPDGQPGGADTELNACSVRDSTISAGRDIILDCSAPLPRSLASSTAELGSVLKMFYVGNPDMLPKPDTYKGYKVGPYCNWWGEWATAVDGLYMVDPRIDVSVAAGEGELVVLKDVKFQIFSKTMIGTPSPSVTVDCQVGGGDNPGHFIDVDTVKSTVVMRSDTDGSFSYGQKAPMPPASITARNVERDNAIVSLLSEPGHFYLGMVRILFEINGAEKILTLGSRQQPLRWISGGDGGKAAPVATQGQWHWNEDTLTWSR